MKIFNSTHRFLSSMKTGLITLAGIGFISAIGSGFLPESFFHGTIFKALIFFLLLNMTLCTVNQVRRYFRIHPGKEGILNTVVLRQTGILTLHAGVVLILIGGIMNAFGGESLPVKIVQGETLNVAEVLNKTQSCRLKLDEFKIEFNDDGSPSQYYSFISLMKGQDIVHSYSISVNNPLKYEGIKAYQHSFGYLVNIRGESGSGWQEEKTLEEGQTFSVQGSNKTIKLYKYIPDFDPDYGLNSKSLRPDNPRVVYSVYEKGTLIKVAIIALGEKIEVEQGIFVTFTGVKPYTVLTLKTDPGLLPAAIGGLMLMLGTCLALFLKPRKQGGIS